LPVLTPERLRLFAFAAQTEAMRHLELLRTFERARDRYSLSLTPDDVRRDLRHDEPLTDTQLTGSLDQLTAWGLLDCTRDAGRVRSLAEYRQRHAVYQLSVMGYQALRAVESVLAHQPSDTELRRLVFRTVLDTLGELHGAVLAGDADKVLTLLDRIHDDLEGLAGRAAGFQLLVHQLTTQTETDAETFVGLKDRLIVHLEAFLDALQRHAADLQRAVLALDALGADRLVDLAVAADETSLTDATTRRATLHRRWQGIRAWFLDTEGSASRTQELRRRSVDAIGALASLLRRVMNARQGGLGRARQLEHLAAWFARLDSDETCHALFQAAFRLRPSLHLLTRIEDLEAVRPQTPWAQAPPEPISTTLRRHGRHSTPGRPPPVIDPAAAFARNQARMERRREQQAGLTRSLTQIRELKRPLTQEELQVLTQLLARALRATRSRHQPRAARVGNVRMVLTPGPGITRIHAAHGTLDVHGWRVSLHDEAGP
jgi:uncharacterized protein (TIGR02677 family)